MFLTLFIMLLPLIVDKTIQINTLLTYIFNKV